MTKTKISKKDVSYIMNYKKRHLNNYLIDWELREAGNTIILNGRVKTLVKLILTIPAAILVILYSLWDGGIKSAIEELKTPMWYIAPVVEYENHYFDSRYDRMKKILNRG